MLLFVMAPPGSNAQDVWKLLQYGTTAYALPTSIKAEAPAVLRENYLSITSPRGRVLDRLLLPIRLFDSPPAQESYVCFGASTEFPHVFLIEAEASDTWATLDGLLELIHLTWVKHDIKGWSFEQDGIMLFPEAGLISFTTWNLQNPGLDGFVQVSYDPGNDLYERTTVSYLYRYQIGKLPFKRAALQLMRQLAPESEAV